MVGGMLVFSCGLIGTAFAPSAEVLYAARVVTALGAGIVSPGAAAVAVASVPPERRGQALSIAFGGITLSQVVGVPASSYLGYHYGWPSVFVFMTAAAVAMAIALWLKVPSDLRIAPARLSDLVATLKDFNLAIAVLLTATVMGAGWIPYTFLAAMVEEKLPGNGAGAIAVMLVAYGVGSVLGNAIGGKLTDRVGSNRALLVIMAAQVPLTAAISVVPWISLGYGAAMLLIWGMVGWAFMVPQQARLVSLDPSRVQVLLALNAACIYVGASFGATIAGLAKGSLGVVALGPLAAAIVVVGIAQLLLSIAMTKRLKAA
jgi:predicted MFS family arabinose efflux permease